MNRITIFHYHLLPGGVTNVIELGAIALIRFFPNLQLLRIVCGNKENTDSVQKKIESEINSLNFSGTPPRFELNIMPEIDYLEVDSPLKSEKIEELADSLCKSFGDSFWWIHNYQLGKNPLFTAAVIKISRYQSEQKMLLQIHDFPECARFDNLEKLYRAGVKNPYPISDSTAYGVINSRDKAVLKTAGIPEARIFLIHNPVEDKISESSQIPPNSQLKKSFYEYYETSFPCMKPDGKIIFYPVRTIRRKNVLEAGLIASLSKYPVNLIVSLPGTSEQEKKYSQVCEQCFREGLIPGIWGSGISKDQAVPSYTQMLEISDLILSSSVQEGFGYLFINAVKLGIPLVARDLDILNGIRNVFPDDRTHFYKSILVPIEQKDAEIICNAYHKKLQTLTNYISKQTISAIHEKTDRLTAEGIIDFSFLTVELQLENLKRVHDSNQFREDVELLNRNMMENLYVQLDKGRYQSSAHINDFSLKTHAETVETITGRLYSFTNTNPIPERNVQQKLLDNFAELEYMRLLYDF